MHRRPLPFPLTLSAGVAIAALSLTACPMPQSSAARMQETASDFNTNIRFGRMSLAIENVAAKEREAFLARRKHWEDHIQLADYELLSARILKGDEGAEVMVKYDWYDVNAGDLHVTTIRQHWEDHKGTWELVGESREKGAPGLFAEDKLPPAGPPPTTVQFPTVRLGD